jgi:hypothetical protein
LIFDVFFSWLGRSNFQETVFWTNYFHHCEQKRKEHFGCNSDTDIDSVHEEYVTEDDNRQSNSFVSNNAAEERSQVQEVEDQASYFSKNSDESKELEEEDQSEQPSQNSLIPADDSHFESDNCEDITGDDDYSFICVDTSEISSPPCSLNSVDDLILVNKTISSGK